MIPTLVCILVGLMVLNLALIYRDVKAMDARIKHFNSSK
jgi:hypothetical protein